MKRRVESEELWNLQIPQPLPESSKRKYPGFSPRNMFKVRDTM